MSTSKPARRPIDSSLIRRFDAGDTIVHEDNFDRRLFVHRSGIVDVYKGSELINSFHEEGILFGEMSWLTNYRRTATLKARTRCELYVLDQSLPDLIRRYPGVAEKIMLSLVERCLNHETTAVEGRKQLDALDAEVTRLRTALNTLRAAKSSLTKQQDIP